MLVISFVILYPYLVDFWGHFLSFRNGKCPQPLGSFANKGFQGDKLNPSGKKLISYIRMSF
jgi:hypothetical protein